MAVNNVYVFRAGGGWYVGQRVWLPRAYCSPVTMGCICLTVQPFFLLFTWLFKFVCASWLQQKKKVTSVSLVALVWAPALDAANAFSSYAANSSGLLCSGLLQPLRAPLNGPHFTESNWLPAGSFKSAQRRSCRQFLLPSLFLITIKVQIRVSEIGCDIITDVSLSAHVCVRAFDFEVYTGCLFDSCSVFVG